jgi:hypothetical protein
MTGMGDRILLTVEDSFAITGRGVVVLPGVEPGTVPWSCRVRVQLPDGSLNDLDASFELPFGSPGMKPQLWCLLKGVRKEDIPVGTKVIGLSLD